MTECLLGENEVEHVLTRLGMGSILLKTAHQKKERKVKENDMENEMNERNDENEERNKENK